MEVVQNLATPDEVCRCDVLDSNALHYAAAVPENKRPELPAAARTSIVDMPSSTKDEMTASATTSILVILLKASADSMNPKVIEAADLYGRTALHYACLTGNLDCVRILVRKSDVNAQTRDRTTPLHCAAKSAYENRYDIVAELLRHEATRNARDSLQMLPFMWSAFRGDIDATRVLLENLTIFERYALDVRGRHATHFAALSGNVEVFNLCKGDQGMELLDKDNLKPAHLAAARNHSELLGRILRNKDWKWHVAKNVSGG